MILTYRSRGSRAPIPVVLDVGGRLSRYNASTRNRHVPRHRRGLPILVREKALLPRRAHGLRRRSLSYTTATPVRYVIIIVSVVYRYSLQHSYVINIKQTRWYKSRCTALLRRPITTPRLFLANSFPELYRNGLVRAPVSERLTRDCNYSV